MFRKVMVPLDGSALAEQAIGPAAAIARAAEAELDLVMVLEPLPLTGFTDADWGSATWAQDDTYLDGLAAELATGASVPVTRAILQGVPAEVIGDRIAAKDTDLLVMTTHGRTGLSRAWVGSTADRLVRHSSVPVLMLRPIEGKTRAAAARHLFKRILVALDGSPFAAEILSAASALATCSEGRLVLLQVVQPVPLVVPESMVEGYPLAAYPPRIVDRAATDRLVTEAEERLAETAHTLSGQGIECETQVVVAEHVAQAILDAAARGGGDAIAMATRGRGASRLFMGGIADKVLRSSELPLLLRRPLAVGEPSLETTSVVASAASATAAHT